MPAAEGVRRLRGKTLIRDEKGQSLTEFAIIVPMLLLLLCGIFDFGRLLFGYLQLNLLAQETVRLAGLGKGDAAIVQYARDHAPSGNRAMLGVDISPSQATRKSGEYVKVTLEMPHTYITPVISRLLPATTVRADSTIRVE